MSRLLARVISTGFGGTVDWLWGGAIDLVESRVGHIHWHMDGDSELPGTVFSRIDRLFEHIDVRGGRHWRLGSSRHHGHYRWRIDLDGPDVAVFLRVILRHRLCFDHHV